MTRNRSKPEAPREPPASAAAFGTPSDDFRVPGPHGLVVFKCGKRVLVEPQIRRLLSADAPIVWEEE